MLIERTGSNSARAVVNPVKILRGRELWGKSFRDVTAADFAVIGASIEPTAKGVRTALETYAEILRETGRSFGRVLRSLAPITGTCLGVIGIAAAAGGISLPFAAVFGITFIGITLAASHFQAQSDNSSRLFSVFQRLEYSFRSMEPAIIRAGLLELKTDNRETYDLILNEKALSGAMGRFYGEKFIDFLRHFEA